MKRSTRYLGGMGLALVVMTSAGCGGGGSASPFGNTSLDSRGDLGARATGSGTARSNRMVPVYLSTSGTPTAEDAWIQIAGVQVSGSSERHQVLPEGDRLWVGLNALRGAEGRRFLFLGMVPGGPKLVRAQVSLGPTARIFVTGAEKPVEAAMAKAGQTSETLSVNLDSGAELKDALVLDVTLEKADKAWTPKLTLGSADGVQDPRRHTATWLGAKVVEPSDKPDSPWSLQMGDAKVRSLTARVVPIGSAKQDAKPAKGAAVRVLGTFDPASGQLVSSETVWGDWGKSGMAFLYGTAVSVDPKAFTMVLTPTLAWGAAPTGTSVQVAMPGNVFGEDGGLVSLVQAADLVPGRSVWLVGPAPKDGTPFGPTLAGMVPTPKIDANRDRQPIPPLPVTKGAKPN